VAAVLLDMSLGIMEIQFQELHHLLLLQLLLVLPVLLLLEAVEVVEKHREMVNLEDVEVAAEVVVLVDLLLEIVDRELQDKDSPVLPM